MLKLRNFTILSTKLAHFKIDVCYRCMFTLVFFSKQFEDLWEWRFWVFVVLVFEFGLLFACWRVCSHLWHCFHLMRQQMFCIGERSGLQERQFSTRSLLWQSRVVVALCSFAMSCFLLGFFSYTENGTLQMTVQIRSPLTMVIQFLVMPFTPTTQWKQTTSGSTANLNRRGSKSLYIPLYVFQNMQVAQT